MDKEKYLKDLKEFKRFVTSNKKRAKKFLMETGICDKKGNLTKNYK